MHSIRAASPGWPEIVAGLVSYLLLLGVISLWLAQIPDGQAATRGIVGMAANGLAGASALLVACVVRIRKLSSFGFRRTEKRWLAVGGGLGAAAVGLSFLIEHVYFLFVTEANTQGDFQAAAQAGLPTLALLVFTGAILTPFGEEVLFRGVIANALNRYGAWVGVVGGAAVFAIVHGPSVIFLNAFLVGILTGILYRKANSVWPCVVVHVVFNGIWLIIYSFQ